MKILLIGEYSNVHNTLAEGLRALGHSVTVASNGDFWKDYPRDIDLQRKPGLLGSLSLLFRVIKALPKMRGYDIVQLINPMFLELKANKLFPIYQYLRQHNKKIVLGAFGMDYYWVHVNDTLKPLRYSDFNIGNSCRHDAAAERERKDWVGTKKQTLNEYIANDCDGIVCGLYEYWVTYQQFADKTQFIPFPIKPVDETLATFPKDHKQRETDKSHQNKLRIFVGISKSRSAYKGTDIMLEAAKRLQADFPDSVELKVANGVPFAEYQNLMNESDCILDQLYSYTPAMNALLAMSKGIVVVGGGEPENYEILTKSGVPVTDGGERDLRPIQNVIPIKNTTTCDVDYEQSISSCYKSLKELMDSTDKLNRMKQESIEYINRHHDYIKVAKKYVEFYNNFVL